MWHGPHWLILPQANWPEPGNFDSTDIESKKVTTLYCIIDDHILTRFASLTQAIRVIAYVLGTLQKSQSTPKSIDLIADEITYSKNTLIKLSQQYEYLTQGRQINNKSNLLSLAPFLDISGIMRVCGRL